jgi:UDP-N-acetylmuramate-alanine ligase
VGFTYSFGCPVAQVIEVIDDMVQEDGIVLTLGAGDVGGLPGQLLDRWGETA